MSLKPLEEKRIQIEFDTYIDFPENILISRKLEKKDGIEKYNIEL